MCNTLFNLKQLKINTTDSCMQDTFARARTRPKGLPRLG